MVTPELHLLASARITPRGVTRGGPEVPVSDPFFVARLHSGVQVDVVAEMAEGPSGARLRALHRAGLLVWRLAGFLEMEVLTTGVDLAVPKAIPGPLRLSRFAALHREGDRWLLDSGLSPWRGHLTKEGLQALAEDDADGWFAGLLAVSGMSDSVDAGAEAWSLHDRLFHSRTRGGMVFLGSPARDRGVPAEPALRETRSGISLPRPEGPEPGEPSLWEATQSRRTLRDFADRQVTMRALGHVLWRTVRIKEVHPADPEDPQSYDAVLRPVPSGGAMHATDLWLFCRDVEDLAPGAYLYDPVHHALVPAGSLPDSLPAPVVGLLTARHKRTAWKYEPIALSLELQDVGVQWMALQLAASVVGLSVVPLGGGFPNVAGDLLGLDEMVDAPVGQFLLGPVR